MDMEKRGMGMNDYNGDMRKGGRGGGGAYRPPVSKEVAPGDAPSFYDKVILLCYLITLDFLSFSCLFDIVLSHYSLFPYVVLPCLSVPHQFSLS